MSNNYSFKKYYDIDVVFILDATGSMKRCIQTVKEHAASLYEDLVKKMDETNRGIHQMRIRFIAFRDYLAYREEKQKHPRDRSKWNEPMTVTDFFSLPEETDRLQSALNSIHAVGGGDDLEDGLEALAYAIRSDWSQTVETSTRSKRQIIVLWTDDGTHELGFGSDEETYPGNMAKSFQELTSWWEGMDENAKRLLLYAPAKERWTSIANGWDNVMQVVIERDEYVDIMDSFKRSQEYGEMVKLLIKTL